MTDSNSASIVRGPIHAAFLFVLPAALLASGCSDPFAEVSARRMSVDPDALRSIDTMSLNERSRTEPRTVEEASELAMKLLSEEGAEIIASRGTDEDTPVTITLEEVRAAALEGNLDLKVQLISPTIAERSIDIEEARFESAFRSSVRRSRTDSPTSVATEGSQIDFTSASFGLDLPLRTGGNASIDLPITKTATNNPFSLLDPSYTSDLRFSISQPFLRNAGVRTNTHAIRVAEYEYDISGARTKLEAIRVLAAADRAYWLLYATQRERDVSLAQYDLAMEQLERAERQVRAGSVPEVEIIRAQSGVAQRLEAIIVSDNSVRRAARNLRNLMQRADLPLEREVPFILDTDPDPLGLDLDPIELADLAVDNRMEMLELELQLARDASTIEFQRNARLPLFTLDYSYNINGLDASWRRSFGQIPDHSFEDWSVGLNAEVPLGNLAAQSRFERAILARTQRLATREQRRSSIRQEVLDAVDQLRQNWQRIIAARQAAILAGRTYDAERRQFEEGARTSTDVLDAATRLADAQSSEIRALADYQVAQVDLAFATGTLLGYERVRFDWNDAADALDEENRPAEGTQPQPRVGGWN